MNPKRFLRKLRSGKTYPIPERRSFKPTNNSPAASSESDSDSLIQEAKEGSQINSSGSEGTERKVDAENTDDLSTNFGTATSSTPRVFANSILVPLFSSLSLHDNLESTNCETKNIKMAQFDREEFKDVPEFGGNSKELPQFISIVDEMNEELADDQKMILFKKLRIKLKGKAYEIYAENVERTWDSLKLELEQSFLVRKDYMLVSAELQRITQGRNESVKHYSDRVTGKFTELKQAVKARFLEPGARATILEEQQRLVLKAYKNGLQVHLKNIVKAARDLTLADAIRTAMEEEEDSGINNPREFGQGQGAFQRRVKSEAVAWESRGKGDFEPRYPQRDNFKKENETRRLPNAPGNPFKREEFKPAPQRACNRCGRTNHLAGSCFAMKDIEGNSLTQRGPNRTVNFYEGRNNMLGEDSKNANFNGSQSQTSLTQKFQDSFPSTNKY